MSVADVPTNQELLRLNSEGLSQNKLARMYSVAQVTIWKRIQAARKEKDGVFDLA